MQVQKPSARAAVQSLRAFLLQDDIAAQPAARASLAERLGYGDWVSLVAAVDLSDSSHNLPSPASGPQDIGQLNVPPSADVIEFMESLKAGRLAVWHRGGQTFPRLRLVDYSPFVAWKEGRPVNWAAPVAEYVEVSSGVDVAAARCVQSARLADVRQLKREGVHWRVGATLVLAMSLPESLAASVSHFYTKS